MLETQMQTWNPFFIHFCYFNICFAMLIQVSRSPAQHATNHHTLLSSLLVRASSHHPISSKVTPLLQILLNSIAQHFYIQLHPLYASHGCTSIILSLVHYIGFLSFYLFQPCLCGHAGVVPLLSKFFSRFIQVLSSLLTSFLSSLH